MMRWRAYQANTWRRMTDSSDVFIYFCTWKLATFPRFCTLDDLDLQLISVGQVPDGYPKPARGHLFNS